MRPGPSSCPYSPNCREKGLSETHATTAGTTSSAMRAIAEDGEGVLVYMQLTRSGANHGVDGVQ